MLFSVETGLMVVQLSNVSCDIGINLCDISLYDNTMGLKFKGFQIEEPLKERPKKEELKEEPIKVETYITGKVENKYLQEVQKTLFLMPVIEKYLKDNNWKIICKDTRIDGANSGLIDYKKKQIEIFVGGSIANSVTHECGHLFDYMLQYTLNNSKFTKLYKKEVEDFRKIDDVEVENTRNEREYFAESFRLYLQDNAEFKDFQTYKTIERIIKNEEK